MCTYKTTDVLIDPTICKDPKEENRYWFKFYQFTTDGKRFVLEPRWAFFRSEEKARQGLKDFMSKFEAQPVKEEECDE